MLGVDAVGRQRIAQYRYWREDVSGRPDGAWADLDGVQVHTTGLDPLHWNGAHLTRPTDLSVVLPEVRAWFAARDKPWALLAAAELDAQPPGLRHVTDQNVMLLTEPAHSPRPVLPAGLTVRLDAPAADIALVQSEAFGDPYDVALAFVEPFVRPAALPPQQTLTAYEGCEPVGCATVAVMGDVAGIYGVAVRDRCRRRGLGAHLTGAMVGLAVAAGCDLVYLNPSQIGYGVYARLGFSDATPYRIWVPA